MYVISRCEANIIHVSIALMHHLSRVHLFEVLNTRFLRIVTKHSFNKLLIVIIQIKLIRNVHKPTNVKVTNKCTIIHS